MTPDRARELPLTPPVDPRAVGTVGAFVVTYRRPELLVQTLRTIRLQTHAVQSVVVLNNDPAGAVFGASLWRPRPLQPPPALRNGTRPYPVDVAPWAGMLVHRRTVEQVGYPRAEFFRCFADYEFCLRVRAAGLRVFAVPTSRVRHEHGAH